MEKTPLQQVFQVNCPLHPSNPSDILHVSASVVNHRACIKCVLSGGVQPLAAIDLRNLFQMTDDEDSILSCYPPLEDAMIYKQLENIQQYSVSKTIEQIERQISNLKLSFEEILDKIKKDSIVLLEELGKQRRQVLDLYQSLCDSNKLKEAVLQASETKQQSRLHELILKKCQDSVINTSKLQSVINQFQAKQEKFSIQLANEPAESLRNISFFTSPITPIVHSYSILKEFELVPSRLFNVASRTVISRKENNQLDALCIQESKYVCWLNSSNVLDNNTHYRFRFAFHQEATEGGPIFTIGLINQKHKNKAYDFNIFEYSEYSQDCGINKIIKGVALNSGFDAKNMHKEVEIRVHLASRTVKVADFPNYNNVVELADKKDITEGSQYCLFIFFSYAKNHITLRDVIVSDHFDSSM